MIFIVQVIKIKEAVNGYEDKGFGDAGSIYRPYNNFRDFLVCVDV